MSRRAHAWVAAAITVAVPLAFDPAGWFIFLPSKWALAAVLVGAGLTLLVLRRRPVARPPAAAAWLVLLAVLALASLLGIGGVTSWIGYPGRSLGMVAWLVFFFAFLLGASLRDDGDRRRVVRAASAAAVLVSVYALLQAVDVDPVHWSENVDTDRARSTLGNAAFLGAYLVLVIPVAGRLALDPSEDRRARALHGAAAVLGFAALLATQTRGAWLGLVAGVAVVVALEWRRVRAVPVRALQGAVAALVLLVLLATVSPVASRIRSVADLGEATGRGRITQWERTLDLVADRPVLGWGPETYAFAFPEHVDAEFERTVGRDVIPDRAHNLFLDMAAIAGVLGVAALVAVLVLAARGMGRDPTTVGLAGGCAAYLGQLQFSFPLADVDVLFWLFAGLVAASAVPTARPLRRPWAALPMVLALGAAVWGIGDMAADRTLRHAIDAEASGDFVEAQRLVDRSADLAPGRAQYLQAAGRLHTRVGEVSGRPQDFARALAAVEDARDLVPRDPELLLDRADLLLAWGEVTGDRELVERAARDYEAILDDDPHSSRVHLRLGVAYVQVDRSDDAEQEWLTAASLSPDAPGPLVNLGILYAQQGEEAAARAKLEEALHLDPDNAQARDALAGLDR